MLGGSPTINTTTRTITGLASLPAGITFDLVTQPGGGDLAVLRVGSLEISAGAAVRVIGDRPLVVIAATDIGVVGTLDASANRAEPGAGGGHPDVVHDGRGLPGANDGGAGGSGGVGDSGGGGGGNGTAGGRGGGGGGPQAAPAITIAGPMGGPAHGTGTLAILRGGGAVGSALPA